ncbi:rare lipoprotein A [Alkalibacillus flavidus]|uniref:Rare lipoprotein A n=1 Tax=Alkalibacillus flavidus TaxID=546021 RepID=A0ABV2KXM5_9BACI
MNDYEQLYYLSPTYVYAPFRVEHEDGSVAGDATWTEGGEVTKCNLSWSDMNNMTTAVSPNSPYQCGDLLKVTYLETGQSITVKVVDSVSGYPKNRLNLHRQAFQALGANLDLGVIPVVISRVSASNGSRYEQMLMNMMQAAFPNARMKQSRQTNKEQMSGGRMKETYEMVLETEVSDVTMQGDVVYHPTSQQVQSIHFKRLS